MFSLRTILPVAAAGAALYYITQKTARFVGDKAKVGDDVFAPVNVAAPAMPGLPAGVAQVMVHVTSVTGNTLVGTVTGAALAGAANFLPLPGLPMQVATVDRSAVTGIMRGGKTVSL